MGEIPHSNDHKVCLDQKPSDCVCKRKGEAFWSLALSGVPAARRRGRIFRSGAAGVTGAKASASAKAIPLAAPPMLKRAGQDRDEALKGAGFRTKGEWARHEVELSSTVLRRDDSGGSILAVTCGRVTPLLRAGIAALSINLYVILLHRSHHCGRCLTISLSLPK
jgi:hypothetical protein